MIITNNEQLHYEILFEDGRKVIKVRKLLTVEKLLKIWNVEFHGVLYSKLDVHTRYKDGEHYTEIHIKKEG